MALPAGVVVALGELAMSPKVQDFAGKLVRDVYGKIMPSRKPRGESGKPERGKPASLEEIAARIDDLPTRDELTAAFAVLQAELEREQQIARNWLRAVFAMQVVIVVGGAIILV